MGLTKYKFARLIELCFIRNTDKQYDEDSAIGVNIDKEIRVMKGDTSNKDIEKFYVVKPDFFVYNPRGSRKLGLGYNDSENTYITTFNNMIFRVRDDAREIVLPYYLFMYLSRPEWDRKAEMFSWGSSTEVFAWDTFCDMEIELPDITVQQKYVDIYKGMLQNQQCYERGLEDLKKAVFAEIETIKHTANKVPVGELLEEVDVRNRDERIQEIQGINIDKVFMPSVADASSVNLKNYKVVHKGQFAYSSMQTGRDECIRIALFDKEEPIIISPAYSVLQPKTEDVIAEYIMLWFLRPETDRLGWFASDASIRANLDLDRFYQIEIPLPDRKKQKAIADIYSAFVARRDINEKLKAQIKNICPILIRGAMKEA